MDDIIGIRAITESEALTEMNSDFDGCVERIDSYGQLEAGEILTSGLKIECIFHHPESSCVWLIASKDGKWYSIELEYRVHYLSDIPF